MTNRVPLGQLAKVFLRLGTTAFGGPAAHIAIMDVDIVQRRRWLTREEFLDYLGAVNLIPGPNSTELAIHIGFARAGWPGLLVAGSCFILPAAFIVGLIAWAYARYGTLPAVLGVLDGVKPVVIAIVAQALWQLGRTAIKSTWLAVVSVLAIAAVAGGVHELLVLLTAGFVCALPTLGARGTAATALVATLTSTPHAMTLAAAATTVPFSLTTLFVVFAKIGAVLFGSGYVLLAFLRADFVDRLGWLTESQLLDSVAVGQITPGPVFTTATFVGYVLGGAPGAVVATLAIFLPAFLFVALSGPLVPRVRRSRFAGAVLDGVTVASLALMAVVTWQLARATLIGPLPIIVCAVSFVALVQYRINATWLIAAAAVVGWVSA